MRELRVMRVDDSERFFVDSEGLDDIEVYTLGKALDGIALLHYAATRGVEVDPRVLDGAMQFAQRLAARFGYTLNFEKRSRKYWGPMVRATRDRYMVLKKRLEERPASTPQTLRVISPPDFTNSPLPG